MTLKQAIIHRDWLPCLPNLEAFELVLNQMDDDDDAEMLKAEQQEEDYP